jgi:Na+-transporting NADH:ubiquinone oxidoreductase subunit E
MTHYLDLFVRAAFVENLALSFFLGMCMFLAVSRRIATALGFGAAMMLVQTITVPLNQVLYTRLLQPGAWAWAGLPELDLSFLRFITAIGVIAAFVQIVEMVFDRFFPGLFRTLGIFLPLLTVNCAILGGSLFMMERHYGLGEAAVYGFGSGFGWALALAVLAGLREKLEYADVPEGLRGLGLSFLVVGLVSLAFVAFAGIELR